jgi:hypothetical protein
MCAEGSGRNTGSASGGANVDAGSRFESRHAVAVSKTAADPEVSGGEVGTGDDSYVEVGGSI